MVQDSTQSLFTETVPEDGTEAIEAASELVEVAEEESEEVLDPALGPVFENQVSMVST